MWNIKPKHKHLIDTHAWRPAIALLCLALQMSCGLAEIFEGDGEPAGALLQIGETAPNFTLQTLQGEIVELNSFRGRPVLVNFWATWCGPCRAEMPDIQEAFEAHQGDSLVILCINVEESSTKVATFIEKNGYSFPVLLDSQGDASDAYRIRSIPTSLFLDADGVIREVHIGVIPEEKLESILADLLARAAAQQGSTPPQSAEMPGGAPDPALTVPSPGNTLEGCVSSQALNLRGGPGVDYPALDWLSQGDCATFDARSTDSAWLRLTEDRTKKGKRLWASAKHIRIAAGDIDDLQTGE